MPQTADRDEIRRILETDRTWAAYALADLEPEHFCHSEWFCHSSDPPAIVLVYHQFEAPVVIAAGNSEVLPKLLQEADQALGKAQKVYFVTRPELLSWVERRYDIVASKRMRRMLLPADSVPFPHDSRATRLDISHLEAVEDLYADGVSSGESPDFFTPDMLEQGIYFGTWDENRLTAVAGTHIVAPSVAVGAIGNVYTRRSHRRRGLCAAVTGAVTECLRAQSLETIVLNVWSQNPGAFAVYERLGFRYVCDFFEIVAGRAKPPVAEAG